MRTLLEKLKSIVKLVMITVAWLCRATTILYTLLSRTLLPAILPVDTVSVYKALVRFSALQWHAAWGTATFPEGLPGPLAAIWYLISA